MITFTAPTVLTGTQTNTDCIAYPAQALFQVDTDIPTASFTAGTYNWYLKPALYINAAALLGENATNPGAYCFILSTPPATALATPIETPWGGTAKGKQGRCWLTFTDNGGVIRVSIAFKFITQMDFDGYAENQALNNHDKLFKNSKNATADLTNTAPSVYNELANNSVRLAFWVNEPTSGDWAFIKLQTANNVAARFYNRGLGIAPMERIVEGSAKFRLERNNQLVADLSNIANTLVKHRVEMQPGFLPNKAYLMIIGSNTTNNTVTLIQNYGGAIIRFAEDGLPADAFTDWDLANGGVWIPPNTAITNLSGNIWEFSMTIEQSSTLPVNKYRIIAIWETDTDPATGAFIRYSFISDELTVSTCPALYDGNVVLIDGKLHDYLNVFDDYLRVAPKERIRSQLLFDAANYDADPARTGSFIEGFNKLVIRIYSVEAPNLTHIYEESVITKDLTGNWNLAAYPNLTIDPLTGEINFIFRVRYEESLPNLYTLQGNAQITPQTTMSWVGKTVYLEYELFIDNNNVSPLDIIRKTQILEVKEYYADFTSVLHYAPEGTQPSLQFCEGDPDIIICITDANNAGEAYFIPTIEGEVYGVANLAESDPNSGGGALPLLTTPLIIAQAGAFSADPENKACATIAMAELQRDRSYLFCAIKKGTPILACGEAADSGGAGDPITNTHAMGVAIGRIVVAFQMYAITVGGAFTGVCNNTDGLELDWNGNTDNSTENTGCGGNLHFGDGTVAVQKTAATPNFAEVTVTPGANIGGTQWWYKIFCVDYCRFCGRWAANLANVRLAGAGAGETYLHEEAEVFCLETEETGYVTLNYTIPATHAFNIYRIAVYYNGALAATTISFLQGSGALVFNHTGAADYFVVIITLFPYLTTANPAPLGWEINALCPGVEEIPAPGGCPTFYDYPLPAAAADNNSETQCFVLPRKGKCETNLPLCGELWNETLCSNDKPYFQPVCFERPLVSETCGYSYQQLVAFETAAVLFLIKCSEAQEAYFAAHNDFADFFADLGLTPPTNTPYVFSLDSFTPILLAKGYGRVLAQTQNGCIRSFGVKCSGKIVGASYEFEGCIYCFNPNLGEPIDIPVGGANNGISSGCGAGNQSWGDMIPLLTVPSDIPPIDECAVKRCEENDLIYLQFSLPDRFNDWENTGGTYGWQGGGEPYFVALKLADGCCNELGELPAGAIRSAWVGVQENIRLQTIIIDPSFIDRDCFQFKVELLGGANPCGAYFTEPYKRVNCEETVLLEGDFGDKFDCDGFFFGEPDKYLQSIGSFLPYKLKIRVRGEIALKETEIQKERSAKAPTQARQIERWRLRTEPLPPYVAEQIIRILTAKTITAQNKALEFAGNVSKNVEKGKMWFIDCDLNVIKCLLSYNCG